MTKNAIIVIPARYGSTRFPGKPLTLIAGKTMLQRVYEIATQAILNIPNTQVVIATEDERIHKAAQEMGAKVVMTPADCKTGSDRALAACEALSSPVDYVVNLQGDAPLTPPFFISAILENLIHHKTAEVSTPYVQLSWQELDNLRQRKINSPFSGTTLTVNQDQKALWFSKNIIPAIRDEEKLRKKQGKSPVLGHIGLYAYTYSALKQFVALPEGKYENLEGLEQLRLLENNICIQGVEVDYRDLPVMSGVDTPHDAKRAEELILAYGEILHA